jgi:hypothetical protein
MKPTARALAGCSVSHAVPALAVAYLARSAKRGELDE